MSRFSGKQYRGAMRDHRRIKREEAEVRQQAAIQRAHPTTGVCDCPKKKVGQPSRHRPGVVYSASIKPKSTSDDDSKPQRKPPARRRRRTQ